MKVRLGDYVLIKTGKLDANIASENGRFPFFTCGVEPLKIDKYSYDCECVLVAGNGDLNVKYYYGKFDAYQRTYIIESKNKNLLSVKYLYFFLDNYLDTLRNEAIGGVIKYIKLSNLSEAKIKLLDLEKQLEIVNILEKINLLISLRKNQLKKLDELVKFRFIEMFDNKKRLLVKMKDVCDFITKGATPNSSDIFNVYSEGVIPYIKVYNLSFNGELLFEDKQQFIKQNVHENLLKRSKVYPNDVLMNIVGPPLGKFALVTKQYKEWNVNQAIAIFRSKSRILPEFLLYSLMQPAVLKPFLDQAVGIRQLNISLEQCRNIKIPLPDIDEQKEFVCLVEQTTKSKLEIQKSLDKLEILKKSLMQKYFG